MKELNDLLYEMLPYFPKVYHQASYTPASSEDVRNFNLIYKFTTLPSDSLIYFVPNINSINGTNNLIIKVPTSYNDEPSYREYSYTIVVETNDGSTRLAQANDLIAFRMCIFRFAKGNNKQVILTNSPAYNSLQITTLNATQANFSNTPTVGENTMTRISLATMNDVSELTARVESLENKIIFGTKEPEEALATSPNGTIYIQVEED